MQTIKYGNSENEKIEFNTKNVSIIGGNGSGKSSLMRKIKQQNTTFTIISAHKNLSIKQGAYRAQDDIWLTQNKSYFKNPTAGDAHTPSDNNSVQDDFNQIIEIIFRDYSNETIEAFNSGKTSGEIERKLDKIFDVWNLIFTGKRLLYKDKKIKVQVVGEENYYDIENLSDGERVVLYVLLKLALSEQNTTVIIDEPETFLNPAILNSLFDECEKLNSSSSFVYFSHDLEFVTTRKDNTIFWIKNYTYPSTWQIEPIDAQEIPEELIVKVVGAKKEKILFVESEENKDSQLYQLIYPDFKVWSVGSCENVINYTKAFNSRTEKFNKEYFGLIDRDLRSDEEITSLAANHIFCLPVAVYENLFLNKGVISFVFQHLGKTDAIERLAALEVDVRAKFVEDNFKSGYIKSRTQKQFNLDIDSLISSGAPFVPNIISYRAELDSVASKSYENLLKVFNQKNLKGCITQLGYKWPEWQTQVLNIFNTDKASEFRALFLTVMPNIE